MIATMIPMYAIGRYRWEIRDAHLLRVVLLFPMMSLGAIRVIDVIITWYRRDSFAVRRSRFNQKDEIAIKSWLCSAWTCLMKSRKPRLVQIVRISSRRRESKAGVARRRKKSVSIRSGTKRKEPPYRARTWICIALASCTRRYTYIGK